jgi:hypothetical protein
MTDGTDIAYHAGGLRVGGQGLTAAQRSAELAARRLHAAPLAEAMFGRTSRAGAYAGVVAAVREAQASGFSRESDRAGELGERARAAAGAGDGLTADTTVLAATPPAVGP